MEATCPRNPEHSRFATVAHVVELWEVTKSGDWLSTLDTLETSASPNRDNNWECLDCADQGEAGIYATVL